METVSQSRALPPDMSSQRLGNVNLFMRAIGLDVELLGWAIWRKTDTAKLTSVSICLQSFCPHLEYFAFGSQSHP